MKTPINLLRNSIVSLRGAHFSPIYAICLDHCSPCALLSNCSLRFMEVSKCWQS